MPKGYKRIGNVGDRLKALDFLRSVCHRTSSGHSEYLPNWSDKKVARKVGKLTTAVVRALRVEYIGKSAVHVERNLNRVARQLGTPSSIAAQLPTVAIAEVKLNRLEERIQYLERLLGVTGGDIVLSPNRH